MQPKTWLKLMGSLVLSGLLGLIALNAAFPLPVLDKQQAQVVVSKEGVPLWRFADAEGVWRYPVQLTEVSPRYLEALLNYEDRWFYQHPGINPLALLRAAWLNLRYGRVVSGGSTLSMQVARLIDPHSRTVAGKLKQIGRTLQLEWYYSKEQILTLYLNQAPFGGTLEGVAAASWAYLGKGPQQLTYAEAALLAVLPQAPSRLRPDRHPQRAEQARNKLLQRLQQQGIWPERVVQEAAAEPLYIAPREAPQLAPLLARRLSQRHKQPIIRSTINIELQQRLEALLAGWKHRLPQKTSAAILVVDHQTLEVVAYLGSLDFNDAERFAHVDMVQAIRSPGSTVKPFLYGLALDQGLIHSASLLQDIPRTGMAYQPQNFNQAFTGAVTAEQALQASLNVPVVQLLSHYGAKHFTSRLRSAGWQLLFPSGSEPNLSLILGGTGTNLESLVAAYTSLARKGRLGRLRYLPEQPLQERPLLSEGAAWIIRTLLQRYTAHEPLSLGKLAWKTGTSYGFRDAWSLGINQQYVIGVWLGRPDGTPVPNQLGVSSAMPLLRQVDQLLQHHASASVAKASVPPASVSRQRICWPSGLREQDQQPEMCRVRHLAWLLDNTAPPSLDLPAQEMLWLNEQGLRVPANKFAVAPIAECQAVRVVNYIGWPAALEPWLDPAETRQQRLPSFDPRCVKQHSSAVATGAADLQINGLEQHERVYLLAGQSQLTLRLELLGAVDSAYWYLDGQYLGQTLANAPQELHFTLPGRHQLRVMDSQGKTVQRAFRVLRQADEN